MVDYGNPIFEAMKNLYLILSLLLAVYACSLKEKKYDYYGAKVDSKGAVRVEAFINNVSEVGKPFKVKGRIQQVCQMKGCWITLENERNVNIRVTFKDYGFFVPKNISGREVIVNGIALNEVIDEDVARHYAEDGEAAYDESMRNMISFVAEGVLVAKD